jgi:hypothetical protein
MRLLADDTGVEIVYEITIEGDTAALTAKGVEMSKQDSVVYTAVVEAVAIEAGVDASSVTMTSTPMEKAAPSVPNALPSSDTDTTDTTDNTNEMTIIIASLAGGGSMLLAMIVMCFCRRQQKEHMLAKRVTELVVQRQHDAMNNNPMHSHEHKKKQRRSSKGFPGQVL